MIELPWELELGEPWPSEFSRLVAPARLPDGSDVVVKVALDWDEESINEIDALLFWNGRGAVRLIEHDRELRAMLIERCFPGDQLGREYDDDSLAIAARVLQRLWRAAPDGVEWRRLDAIAETWLERLRRDYETHGRPFERRLLDEGLDALRTLAPTQEEVVLCHQDLHGGNVLRAQRESWLAIDAKPIVAERAYDTVALVQDNHASGTLTLAMVRRRLDVLAEFLALDRERMRGWTMAKHLGWGLEPYGWSEGDIQIVRLASQA